MRSEVDSFAILFVDDDVAVRQALVYILQDRLTILTAGCGAEALELLRTRDITVLLADQRMPGMSGVELCAHARALNPQLVRLITTAYMDIDTIASAMNAGDVTAYIAKPWSDRHIIDALEYAVVSKAQPRLAGAARCKASFTAAAILEYGPFRVDLLAQRAWAGGKELRNLEPFPVRVLGCLIERAGSIWHTDDLIARLYGESAVNSRTISRAISELRQSCDEARALIVNVRNVGYGLLVPPQRAVFPLPLAGEG